MKKMSKEKISKSQERRLKVMMDDDLEKSIKQILMDTTPLGLLDTKEWQDRINRQAKTIQSYLKKEGYRKVNEIKKRLELRLQNCQRQNGLPYCKNCGLCKSDTVILD